MISPFTGGTENKPYITQQYV